MLARYLAYTVCVTGALAACAAPALAYDFENMVNGGRPTAGYYAASPVPRQTVTFAENQRPGTIVISTRERRLYLVQDGGTALRYGIGVGRVGFTWAGTTQVIAKKEWPDWTPPSQMLKRRPDLPRFMRGGPENPLGARAMYLGSSLYRIHGSNEPETIGQAVSSGCFRLLNDDVIDLYSRVKVGAKVIVRQQSGTCFPTATTLWRRVRARYSCHLASCSRPSSSR